MAAANALNISQTGLVTFDGTSSFSGRTLTAGAGISISNGNGVAGNPTITATSAGGYVNLASKTASASTEISFKSVISSSYRYYILYFYNYINSGGAGGDIIIEVSDDNGATYKTAGYNTVLSYVGSSAGIASATANMRIATGVAGTASCNGICNFFGFGTSLASSYTSEGFMISGASLYLQTSGGTGPVNVNAFRVYQNGGGTITTGTFDLYGIV